ncbi:FAS1-like dehydratase domain-containing protein [Nocardioides sp. Kera G14]|uniref:FAS1-like dehydratase domain-containing protein n=1 Tax=Nocardioides sp. Kera G14 TaxID=2884264 RepID=UPI001D103B06|nr:MaoC family dehydratase N-terminal domain-containing protein [Nocardioides sp. Kera G14]UDY23948.1 MaoC family dehydratase N-terminal domain-containing protein [Nocardioides sp. Kera G14]
MDDSLVGRAFAPVGPWLVEAERVAAFASATSYAGPGVPPTFPIVLLNDAMLAFLADVGARLERIVHGEQRFAWSRPVVVGDSLTATMSVSSLRSLGGADLIGTLTVLTDAAGEVIGEARATLVHSAGGTAA